MLNVLKEMFNEPLNFFDKKRNFRLGLIYMLISMFVFVALNQFMIYLGFVKFELKISPLTAIIINYINLVAGYFIITCICIVPFKLLGGRKIKSLFTVVAYSLIPFIFLWIPHILPQVIILIMGAILITTGISKYEKISKTKGFFVALTFFALVILASFVVGNFILPYSSGFF